MSVTVIKPGMLSSFQDRGREGYQHQGIPAAGAMDERAHRLANALAGNLDDPATLEMTLTGPTLRFDAPACFALAGADLGATLNGQDIPLHRPLVARAGDALAFGARPAAGVRGYLAVHGGFALPRVMGSESTYLRSGFGGFQGRALAKGDQVPLRAPLADGRDLDALQDALWQLRVYLPAALGAKRRDAIRFLPGMHWQEFSETSRQDFAGAEFRISPQSDRMGYRLLGPALSMSQPRQMLSEAACFGTVQVPSGGEAIILMADRQTTGGYPKIAQIATVDLPILAQCAPGQTLRFQPVGLEEAQRLDSERERAFSQLQDALEPLRALLA
ncbi:Allophanate hydrolase subunit 2 [Achromobacter denitrificans]|uniref:5-oxoprolinase subunit C family protein n=1 Tax=Achromobacter denitrificans TaxID=32002 RepID=UPI00078738B2|nr:biotin-dependent carboxyltransferase family protein [Achromobacter denitrificans]ASC64252.1 carboxylase [Achromobacter denitrificans]MDF3939337.1 biotin-dependent carboxyltransferase family protein [Achromobacter denitrificans]OLU06855.1 carboxylase [Achromobacter denitrificans]QCS62611.1 biotin-dependent carboxyltransferase family protein [Achromobacter denitrificans]QKH44639.1 biotin-dependent carboxyltransferase family protein [Achromobacter denitrificans]